MFLFFGEDTNILNMPKHCTNKKALLSLRCRVGKNRDFFKKIKKIGFFWFKSDFFDL